MKEKSPLVFKIEAELHERLEECARRLKQKKYTLAIEAIRAAVDAIEKNDYRLVIPIEFQTTHAPVARPPEPIVRAPGKYPTHKREDLSLNEEKPNPSTEADTAHKLAQAAIPDDKLPPSYHRKKKPRP